jgi:hypothetical protein
MHQNRTCGRTSHDADARAVPYRVVEGSIVPADKRQIKGHALTFSKLQAVGQPPRLQSIWPHA